MLLMKYTENFNVNMLLFLFNYIPLDLNHEINGEDFLEIEKENYYIQFFRVDRSVYMINITQTTYI